MTRRYATASPWTEIAAALLLAGLAVGSAAAAGAPFAADSPSPPPAQPTPRVPPPASGDSLREFLPSFDSSAWDSVTAAYDTNVRSDPQRRIVPRYGIRFDKAEGWHLELGASVVDRPWHIRELDVRPGYDFGRQRPVGALRVRIDLGRPGRWGVEGEAADGVRGFGNHQPYGNTWFGLFAGFDAMQYERERILGLSITRWFAEDRRAALGWVRLEQDPVAPVSDFRFFGDDEWMSRNEAAEPFVGNGVRLHLRRGAEYRGETIVQGLVAETELMVFGGRILGGTREFSQLQSDAWYTRSLPRTAAFHARVSGSLATGEAPRQAWPDLGEAAGLRAFPPRGATTHLRLLGTSRLFLRAEYRGPDAILRIKRIKLLRNLGLKPVPFAEVGAVWGLESGQDTTRIHEISAWKDLRAPKRSEVHWDLGFGLRRDIDYSGILSYIEVDVAWAMGADARAPRYSVQLSRDGFD